MAGKHRVVTDQGTDIFLQCNRNWCMDGCLPLLVRPSPNEPRHHQYQWPLFWSLILFPSCDTHHTDSAKAVFSEQVCRYSKANEKERWTALTAA